MSPGIAGADADRTIDVALADDDLEERLADTRFAVIGVTTPPDVTETTKESAVAELPEVLIYDYTNDRWLSIAVNLGRGTAGGVVEHDPAEGQPPLGPTEMDHAVQIARRDPEVAELIARGSTLNERPVRMGYLAKSGCVTSRCVLVLLDGPPGDAMAQVDLGIEAVVGLLTE